MDPELKAALSNITEHMQAQTDATKGFADQLEDVVTRVERIERHVGLGPSDPPPALPLKILAKTTDARASSTSLDVDAIRGELVSVKKTIAANHADTQAELAKQSSAMGIGVKGAKWLVSAEGRAVVIRLAQLAALAYLSFLAYTHGQMPPAGAQAPQLPPAAESR